MENERLLNEQEMMDATGLRCNCEECLDSNKWAIATAQDRKTAAARDKRWIELVENWNCDECEHLKDDCFRTILSSCFKWQSLKQSI